jgi:hypothetical protein
MGKHRSSRNTAVNPATIHVKDCKVRIGQLKNDSKGLKPIAITKVADTS